MTGVISTPMPSPSMKGMIGWSGIGWPGTIFWPSWGILISVVLMPAPSCVVRKGDIAGGGLVGSVQRAVTALGGSCRFFYYPLNIAYLPAPAPEGANHGMIELPAS